MASILLFLARSLWRSGLLKAILLLLTLSILASLALSSADIGRPYKLFYDLLLFSQYFWLHALLLLWAYELSKNEAGAKLARLPLSTPLSRRGYEAGRFGALLLSALPLLVALALLNLLLANSAVAWQGVLFALSALLAGFWVLALSRFVAPASAVLYSAAIVIIANGVDELYLYTRYEESAAYLAPLASLLFHLWPNFSLFDHSSALVSGAAWQPFEHLFLPVGYALLLGWLIFELSAWRFGRKPL